MSELDTLIVTFQTQLSDVMETVVKTAMFEVTRLVEDGFLEEVKRRNQEVESLRMQLQWVERKLRQGGQEVSDDDDDDDGVQLSCDSPEEQMDDVNQGSGMKKEANSIDRRNGSIRQEITQVADETRVTHMIESQAIEEEPLLPELDVKEEEVNKPVCSSVGVGEWHITVEGKSLPETNSARESVDAQPRQTQENSRELSNDAMKHDIMQVSTGYVSPEEQTEAHMADDLSMEVNRSWSGLTVPPAEMIENQIHAAEKDCNPTQTTVSLSEAKQELPDSFTAEVNALIALGGDHISTPTSPQTRLLKSDVLGVTIKQEVTVGFDDCMESQSKEKAVASFPSFVKQHRTSSVAPKHNPISPKAKVQELMKLHSKVGTGLRLQTAVQQLNRPMKKPHHVLSNSATAALSVAHSQAVNFKSINRMPSTSKAAPPPLSVQRIHLGDKQAAAHNRSGAPWVNIKTQQQSTHSHQNSTIPHPVVSPRQLQRCGQCGKCFPHPSNLKAHLQTHTGERPFCCSLCGRSFTKLSNLKAHRRVHTGERPYCCLACGKRFTQKCNLKRHQRIHLDV